MNKELETIIENEFDCLINDLGCLIGEEWKAEAIKKAVTQAFVLGGVSQQRELLAFEDWVNKNTTNALKDGIKLALENYKKANCY